MNGINEIPVAFGPDQSLVGIVTTPNSGDIAPVACLMLNMGANHRIGPRRINVKLARYLAERGISAIRVDLSGLGDSGPARGSEHFLTQAVHDVQAAMNLIETMLGIRRFMIVGLCSGASNGLAAAVADPRVVGLLMFDGFSFPGRRSRWERDVRRAMAACANPAVLGKTWRWLQRQISPSKAAAMATSIFEPDPPEVTAALFRRSMQQIAERNVAVMMFYTGTLNVIDRDRDHLGEFAHEPFTQKVEYRFCRAIDHSLTSVEAQKIFLGVVGEWAMKVASSRTATGTTQPDVLADSGGGSNRSELRATAVH